MVRPGWSKAPDGGQPGFCARRTPPLMSGQFYADPSPGFTPPPCQQTYWSRSRRRASIAEQRSFPPNRHCELSSERSARFARLDPRQHWQAPRQLVPSAGYLGLVSRLACGGHARFAEAPPARSRLSRTRAPMRRFCPPGRASMRPLQALPHCPYLHLDIRQLVIDRATSAGRAGLNDPPRTARSGIAQRHRTDCMVLAPGAGSSPPRRPDRSPAPRPLGDPRHRAGTHGHLAIPPSNVWISMLALRPLGRLAGSVWSAWTHRGRVVSR